jgi:hypothetical protein
MAAHVGAHSFIAFEGTSAELAAATVVEREAASNDGRWRGLYHAPLQLGKAL